MANLAPRDDLLHFPPSIYLAIFSSHANGTTREWRADLLSLSDNGTNTAFLGSPPPSLLATRCTKAKISFIWSNGLRASDSIFSGAKGPRSRPRMWSFHWP